MASSSSSSSPVAATARVVLITGCSSGIGRALARELAARGAAQFVVVPTARSASAVAELRAEGFEFARQLDVNCTDDAAAVSPQTVVDAVCAQLGRIDVLINNAGVTG